MKRKNVTGKHLYASVIFAIAMMMFSQSASAKMDYTPLRGSSSYDGFGYEKLFDSDMFTKWCAADTHEGYDNGWWVVFKTSKATCPTSYTIVTGDDTKTNKTRNWKTWKIYGANFDSDEAAQKDATEWVLLDDKKNIGSDVIPIDNFIEVTLDMSEINADEYQYFMIYIIEAGGTKHQMAEFAFVEPDDTPEEKVTYTALDGTRSGFGNEFSYPSLVDDNAKTKWCSADSHEGYDNGWWVVFKSSAPILPDYYYVITGDDTGTKYGKTRNWVAWKVYGANFASDEEAAKNADGWVLIDERDNIGTDMLPAASLAKAYFGLETTPSTEYSYFKIEITQIVGGNTMQMSEFAFGTPTDDYEEVSIGATTYATFFTHLKDLRIPEGVQAFTGKINGSSLILNELTGWIPAGTAAILKAPAGKYQFKVTKCSPAVGENDLKGTAEAIAADGTQYVLAEKNGVVGFYKAEGTIPAGKAYIEYTGAAGVKGFFFGEGTTGIENAQWSTVNGQSNTIYDLSGRRVEKATKGIYLINGKKLMK